MARRWAMFGIPALVVAALGGALIVHAASAPQGAKYVGSEACRGCHSHMYGTWIETSHSKAFSALVGAEQKDPKCVKCHVTGFGQPGGFVDMDTTAAMQNVGCESCHGPGSAHVDAVKNRVRGQPWDTSINRMPDNTCVQCHNTHINWKQRATESRAKPAA